jgi:hypothetical protein
VKKQKLRRGKTTKSVGTEVEEAPSSERTPPLLTSSTLVPRIQIGARLNPSLATGPVCVEQREEAVKCRRVHLLNLDKH